MAEIKSAIELAMERTKNLVVDPKEREAMAIKEIEDKVKAVLRRFAESMIDHEGAAKELGKIQGDMSSKRTIIINNLIDEFDVHKDNERLFAIFHAAGIDLPQSIRSDLETINRKFREEIESRRTAIQKRIRDAVAELNITGSAIVPNLDAWDEWDKEVRRASEAFGATMKELKNKARAATESR